MKPKSKRITKTESPAGFSVFEYLYRDASNYKVFGELLLIGGHAGDDFEVIRSACESGLFFIAEQIRIPSLCHLLYEHGGGPTEDDHVFHEVIQFRDALPNETASMPWGTVATMVDEFSRARGNWNYSLSPNWPGDPWTWWKPAPHLS
jgi:hypothetical protein